MCGLTTVDNQLPALAEAGPGWTPCGLTPPGAPPALHHRRAPPSSGARRQAPGRTVEVEGPEVEPWADRVAEANEFVDVSHTLEIFGNLPGMLTRR